MPQHSDPSLIYAWLIPLFPLIGFLINGLLGPLTGKPLPKVAAGGLATAAVFLSFIVACALFQHVTSAPEGHKQATVFLAPWLFVPNDPNGIHSFAVNFELLIDPLSVLMMLIITGVGGLIHLYSTSYMAADKDYQRFFTYLNLFIFFMLFLVMANNLLMLFIGWEGVGLCSYLLIGYFYEKKSAGDAAKKAFIVNRIGDVGVLIGMFFLFHYFGTLDFVTGQSAVIGMTEAAPALLLAATPTLITTLLLMLFFGCTGKSAQIPLYTWLPDAMEGPTPVSALIHAATMVTAGIYLVSRMHALFILSDAAMITIAVVGISTALFAATIGLMQNDIKRVLAYSTVSQLGYMFAACGAGVFAAGMFHVMTHAFFKACLFLGSGSVIHAVEHAMHASHGKHGEENAAHAEHGDSGNAVVSASDGPDPNDPQDMRNMGGLFPRIKVTAFSMMAATAAICGVAPFAGFWSKDQILWRDWETLASGDWVFWGVGFVTALLTAFYMTRMVMKTFFGAPRTEAAKDAHESSLAMIVPIGLLAVLSTITGWAVLKFDTFADFLGPSVGPLPATHNDNMELSFEIGTMIAVVLVMAYCIFRYRATKNNELMTPEQRADHRGWTVQHFLPTAGWYNWVLLNKYFVDEAYNFWFVKLGKQLSTWLWRKFDVEGIDGIVNGVGALAAWSGQIVRRTQNGYVRSYAFSMVTGILLILVVVAVRAMGLHR
jgi:NADH-quinone oxidoreductase subunit L